MNCFSKVCFAVEPKGRMTRARTYFLQNVFVPVSLSDTEKKSSIVHSSIVQCDHNYNCSLCCQKN